MAMVRAGKASEIPEGSIKEFELGGKPVAIARVGGKFLAVSGVCLHRGGPLGQGAVQGTIVTCPWHGWQFDLVSGKSVQNPAAALACYPVRLESDELLVEID